MKPAKLKVGTDVVGLPATDGYVVYTDAPVSALTDPNNFTVIIGGRVTSSLLLSD
jgi:hypothetical protein